MPVTEYECGQRNALVRLFEQLNQKRSMESD